MKEQNKIFLDRYLENCKQLNRSKHTIINYQSDLRKFISWFESAQKLKITQINGRVISKYKDYLTYGGEISQQYGPIFKIKFFFKKLFKKMSKEKSVVIKQIPLAVGSRRRHISSVKNFFEYLKQTHEDHGKLFLINPVKSKIHSIKLKEVDIVHTKMIGQDSWDALIEAQWRIRDRLLLHLLYYGGFRLSEICDVKVLDFDDATKTIKFNRKGGYVHTLKIQKSEYIFSMLNGYLISREINSDFLFANKKGQRVSNRSMHNQIKSLLKKADISAEITPHSFRKACATNLYLKHKDLLFVRDYLNHNDAKVTQTYIDKRTLEGISNILYS